MNLYEQTEFNSLILFTLYDQRTQTEAQPNLLDVREWTSLVLLAC